MKRKRQGKRKDLFACHKNKKTFARDKLSFGEGLLILGYLKSLL